MEKDLKKELRRISGMNSFMAAMFLAFSGIEAYFIDLAWEKMDLNIYSPWLSLVEYTFQYVLNVPLFIFLYKKTKAGKELPPLKIVFCKPQASFWQLVRWIIIGAGLAYVVSLASTILFGIIQFFTSSDFNERTFDVYDLSFSNISMILPMSFYAPFFEEIFFRGTFVRSAGRYSTWGQIVLLGITFGLWHTNYTQIIMAAVLGTWFGFLFMKTKSIFPSMILHFCINTMSAVTSILVHNFDFTSSDVSYVLEHMGKFIGIVIFEIVSLGLIGGGMVLLILEIVLFKDTFKLDSPDETISEGKKALIYLSSPITILVFIAFIVVTVMSAMNLL